MRVRPIFLTLSVIGLLTLSFLPLHYKQALHTKGRLHGFGHVVVFAGLTCIGCSGTNSSFQRRTTLLLLAVLAFTIEGLQHWLMAAPLEWPDILLDLAGISVGFVVFAIHPRRRDFT